MIKSFQFNSSVKGPDVLFFGAIHGNEVCGPKAIRRVMKELTSGKLKLKKGSVTFVPICNPRAHAQNKRYTEENLNRIFRRTKRPRSYEARLANELCALIDRCDIFLDLHSMTANGKPFLFLDYPTKATCAFADIMGPKLAIVGWPELYARSGTDRDSFDTTRYAAHKKKVGLLIECGQHRSGSSARVAYTAILNTLRFYGVVRESVRKTKPTLIRMDRVFFRKSTKEKFAKDWKHLQRVKKNETLFFDAKKNRVRAPYTAYIIMPKKTSTVGEEWLYLGKVNA
jgi:predicted deacylase